MKRDGACTSLWQDTVPDHNTTNRIQSDPPYDVVIVGGGITGITTGLQLAKAGKSVLIAEAQNIGFGTTGGTTAHLNSFMETPFSQLVKDFGEEKTKLVAKAAGQALELIKKNIQEHNIDCAYKDAVGYIYAQDEKETRELDKMTEGFLTAGVPVTTSNSIPVKIPFTKAIEIPGQGLFHPTRYITALAKAFEKLGGTLVQSCRVTAVEENETLEITTSLGHVKARSLIYATHIPPGVNLLHFRCAPYRSYVIAAKLKDKSDYPQALAYDMKDPYHYFRTQEVDGELYLIAGGEDHKTAHEDNSETHFLELEAYVRKFYEIEKVAYRWSSQYYDPVDGLPYIGHLPGHSQQLFVATGYGGIGMTNSHIAAQLLTDLILSGESEYKELFDPNRLKPVAGFSSFVKEAADVVGHLIGGLFPKEKLDELAALANGEAKVVSYEGHKIALYKDEGGAVHGVNPSCTHIKCSVKWNMAEKSWDCPCHGSRFSFDGMVLTAPARKDLEPIQWEELAEK